LNWINRSIARTGKLAAAIGFAGVLVAALPVRANTALVATYQGHMLRFTHVASRSGVAAIGVGDPAFQTLLRETGSFLTWKPGERYILITTSAPTVVSFALGDRRYDVGPIALQAALAPYVQGDEAYLPLRELLRSLDLALREDGAVAVLQPQLASLDVHQEGVRTTVLAHGGALLHARVVTESGTAITYAFDGVGTTLNGTREIGTGGVASIAISESGTVREPITLVSVTLQSGAIPESPQNADGRDVLLAFDGAQEAPYASEAPAEASPTPEPEPPQAAAGTAPAVVTSVSAAPSADGMSVVIALSGNATYEWHRLRDPDNRFWVDISGAQLQGPPIDQQGQEPILSIRVRQNDPTTVRVALSLNGPKAIVVTPSASGLGIAVGSTDVADAPRLGSGSIGTVAAAAAPSIPAPSAPEEESAWKFAPHSGYVATNPRLIVIDPGHGGSDRGTIHGGVAEAALALDMARRLRTILVARGWQVKLTHDSDVDVYQPNDSPHDELQARVDIANTAGARLFVSIHANAYVNSGPYGTTFYVSKPGDAALARAIETRMTNDGTKDDGIVKSHMYVTFHTRMPAVLIETAFLSNPSDYELLTSSAWRQKVAEEMAEGIAEYAQEYPVANQPAQ